MHARVEGHLHCPWRAIGSRAQLACLLQVPVAQHVTVTHQEDVALWGNVGRCVLQAEDHVGALSRAGEVVRATGTGGRCSVSDDLWSAGCWVVCGDRLCVPGEVCGDVEAVMLVQCLSRVGQCLAAHESLQSRVSWGVDSKQRG